MNIKYAAMYVSLECGDWHTVAEIMADHFNQPGLQNIKNIIERTTPGGLAAIVGSQDRWFVWTESQGFESSRRTEPIRSIDEGFEEFIKIFTRQPQSD